MLSRTARLATLVTIATAGLGLMAPHRAEAASRFACGDDGIHLCCISDSSCGSGQFCCAFKDRDVLDCGCGNAT